jgi:hypothetical protein
MYNVHVHLIICLFIYFIALNVSVQFVLIYRPQPVDRVGLCFYQVFADATDHTWSEEKTTNLRQFMKQLPLYAASFKNLATHCMLSVTILYLTCPCTLYQILPGRE